MVQGKKLKSFMPYLWFTKPLYGSFSNLLGPLSYQTLVLSLLMFQGGASVQLPFTVDGLPSVNAYELDIFCFNFIFQIKVQS